MTSLEKLAYAASVLAWTVRILGWAAVIAWCFA